MLTLPSCIAFSLTHARRRQHALPLGTGAGGWHPHTSLFRIRWHVSCFRSNLSFCMCPSMAGAQVQHAAFGLLQGMPKSKNLRVRELDHGPGTRQKTQGLAVSAALPAGGPLEAYTPHLWGFLVHFEVGQTRTSQRVERRRTGRSGWPGTDVLIELRCSRSRAKKD